MNRDSHESLSTADLANASETRARNRTTEQMKREDREARAEGHATSRTTAERTTADEKLAPLFPANVGEEFRARWDQVQFSFVDDPKRAVREGDELVAQVMK